MNFLAHCLLAWPGQGWVAGGVLGDFVKGRVPESLPSELSAGVRLHRRIDTFSNRLADMKPSIARFDTELRRAAPVLLDIVADHCLALTWCRYADVALADFTTEVYTALRRFHAYAPDRGRPFIARMIDTDLLARYDDPAVRDRALLYVLNRLQLTQLSPKVTSLLDSQLPAFVEDFHGYFPKLQAFAAVERPRCLEGWRKSD
jgi:acyl carrier protein phosphodiesterase